MGLMSPDPSHFCLATEAPPFVRLSPRVGTIFGRWLAISASAGQRIEDQNNDQVDEGDEPKEFIFPRPFTTGKEYFEKNRRRISFLITSF
jgi:hypothetical protein